MVGAVLVPVLVIGDLALFERNRGLQMELAARQQQLQRAAPMETLQRELINAIGTLAARNDDPALRAILVDLGIAPAAPAAPPAPPGRGR